MISINVTLLITMLNFILLVILLRIILFKPLLKFLDERARTISDSLTQAEDNRQKAAALQQAEVEIIGKAHQKASDIIDKAAASAHDEGRELVKKAREETQVIFASAQKELIEEADRVKRELRKDVAAMVVALTGKVLDREIREEDHRKIIEEGLNTLEK
jgi:F-type H+-transporting ATPase subunit b